MDRWNEEQQSHGWLHEDCSKSSLTQFFLLLVSHLAFCELTHRITTWIFYVIFLHNLHKIDSPVPAGHRATVPFLYEFEFYTRSHLCNNLEVTPKPFLTDGNVEGTKEVGNRVSKIWALWWARRVL